MGASQTPGRCRRPECFELGHSADLITFQAHPAATGAANWLAIRSYLVTALKHGLGALNAVRRAIFGDPWMPPLMIPA